MIYKGEGDLCIICDLLIVGGGNLFVGVFVLFHVPF
jgi:hypothetical protein